MGMPFAPYTPTAEDLRSYDLLIEHDHRDRTEFTEAQKVSKLVQDMLNFDYYYSYSDMSSVWQSGEAREKAILAMLDSLEDKEEAAQLRAHFNPERSQHLPELYSWYVEMRAATKYAKLRYYNKLDEDSAAVVHGYMQWARPILEDLLKVASYDEAVYALDVSKARHYCLQKQIKMIAVPKALEPQLEKLIKVLSNRTLYSLIQPACRVSISSDYYMGMPIFNVAGCWLFGE